MHQGFVCLMSTGCTAASPQLLWSVAKPLLKSSGRTINKGVYWSLLLPCPVTFLCMILLVNLRNCQYLAGLWRCSGEESCCQRWWRAPCRPQGPGRGRLRRDWCEYLKKEIHRKYNLGTVFTNYHNGKRYCTTKKNHTQDNSLLNAIKLQLFYRIKWSNK